MSLQDVYFLTPNENREAVERGVKLVSLLYFMMFAIQKRSLWEQWFWEVSLQCCCEELCMCIDQPESPGVLMGRSGFLAVRTGPPIAICLGWKVSLAALHSDFLRVAGETWK